MGSWVGEIYAWFMIFSLLFCTQPLQPQIFRVSKFKLFEAMQPQIWGYEINKKLEWWNLCISLKIQSFTKSSLSSLHISLWGQACTEPHGGYFLVILTIGPYKNVIWIIWEHFEMWPRMTSKWPRRSNLKNQCIFDLKTKLRPWNVMEYVIQAVKISF